MRAVCPLTIATVLCCIDATAADSVAMKAVSISLEQLLARATSKGNLWLSQHILLPSGWVIALLEDSSPQRGNRDLTFRNTLGVLAVNAITGKTKCFALDGPYHIDETRWQITFWRLGQAENVRLLPIFSGRRVFRRDTWESQGSCEGNLYVDLVRR